MDTDWLSEDLWYGQKAQLEYKQFVFSKSMIKGKLETTAESSPDSQAPGMQQDAGSLREWFWTLARLLIKP